MKKTFIEKNKSNIFEFSPDSRLYASSNTGEFPLNLFISKTYGKAPVNFYSDELYDKEILSFLLNNAQLVSYSCNGKIEKVLKSLDNFRGGTFFFFYKDVFVKIMVKNQDDSDDHFWSDEKNKDYESKKLFNLNFSGPVGSIFPLNDFTKFIHKSDDCKIHLFIKNSYGEFVFEPLKVKIPENMDLELNYGKQFLNVYENIETRLNQFSSGLYMFHGPSGTGKSTMIKYMAGKIKRDFIYIPTTMLETFTTDPSCLQMLIQKTNSILVLEDAEKLIMKRHGDALDSSSVSSLLNLSDGILSDILNISVIITYNCDTKDIDPALRRKGRLKAEYKFENLSTEDAKILAKHLKYPEELIETEIKQSMSLADIYNLKTQVKFYEDLVKQEKRIGF